MNRARAICGIALVAALAASAGCTRESVRVALENQRRADDVQQAVFERQHAALTLLLYRDLAHRLEQDGTRLTDAQRAALNDVWNDRDLMEFWAMQQERSAALRIAGVDAKLVADQSIIDLLWKQLEQRARRAAEGLATRAGEAVGAAAAKETGEGGAQ